MPPDFVPPWWLRPVLASRIVHIHPEEWLLRHDFWTGAVMDVENAVNISRKIKHDRANPPK